MKMERVEQVIRVLQNKAAAANKNANASAIVGYTAAHALWVHEMAPKTLGQNIPRPSGLGFFWGPAGGPKFLEGPARRLSKVLGGIVREVVLRGKTVAQGLLMAGLRLQRESMKECPREYGDLVRSAFTELEK